MEESAYLLHGLRCTHLAVVAPNLVQATDVVPRNAGRLVLLPDAPVRNVGVEPAAVRRRPHLLGGNSSAAVKGGEK